MSYDRPFRMLVVSLIAVVGATVGLAAPVHASLMQFDEALEGQPSTLWEWDFAGDGQAGFELSRGTARSGANNGWLFGRYGGASEKVWVPTGSVPDGPPAAPRSTSSRPPRPRSCWRPGTTAAA